MGCCGSNAVTVPSPYCSDIGDRSSPTATRSGKPASLRPKTMPTVWKAARSARPIATGTPVFDRLRRFDRGTCVLSPRRCPVVVHQPISSAQDPHDRHASGPIRAIPCRRECSGRGGQPGAEGNRQVGRRTDADLGDMVADDRVRRTLGTGAPQVVEPDRRGHARMGGFGKAIRPRTRRGWGDSLQLPRGGSPRARHVPGRGRDKAMPIAAGRRGRGIVPIPHCVPVPGPSRGRRPRPRAIRGGADEEPIPSSKSTEPT